MVKFGSQEQSNIYFATCKQRVNIRDTLLFNSEAPHISINAMFWLNINQEFFCAFQAIIADSLHHVYRPGILLSDFFQIKDIAFAVLKVLFLRISIFGILLQLTKRL